MHTGTAEGIVMVVVAISKNNTDRINQGKDPKNHIHPDGQTTTNTNI